MTKSTFNLKLLQAVENRFIESDCSIECESVPSEQSQTRFKQLIKFQHPVLGYHCFEGYDLFEAFCNLRLFLERENIKILCNGARIDAYPSPMSREMCGGLKLYVMKEGQRANRKDLIFIFDEAKLERVATVAEQLAYYEKWLMSFKRSDNFMP